MFSYIRVYPPSREVPLEQLIEAARAFPASGETVEDIALKSYQLEKLREVLDSLPDMDQLTNLAGL